MFLWNYRRISNDCTPRFEKILQECKIGIMKSRLKNQVFYQITRNQRQLLWNPPHFTEQHQRPSNLYLPTNRTYTYLTHYRLIIREQPPFCNQCLVNITTKQILVDCPIYNMQRNRVQIKKQFKPILNDNQQFQKVLNLLKTLKLLELV